MTSRQYEIEQGFETRQSDYTEGIGWVGFAAIMLGIAGIWNFFEGILAINSSKVYVGSTHFVFSNLNTWGWIVMVFGILEFCAACSLLSGSEIARWFGIAVAALGSMVQLSFVSAYPWWGITMFVLDMLVIYGLAVYAGKRLKVE